MGLPLSAVCSELFLSGHCSQALPLMAAAATSHQGFLHLMLDFISLVECVTYVNQH